jgi:hypothetical protein
MATRRIPATGPSIRHQPQRRTLSASPRYGRFGSSSKYITLSHSIDMRAYARMLGAYTPLSRDARWVERQRVTSTCRHRGEQKRLSAGCTLATGCVSQPEVGRRKRAPAGAARSHQHNCDTSGFATKCSCSNQRSRRRSQTSTSKQPKLTLRESRPAIPGREKHRFAAGLTKNAGPEVVESWTRVLPRLRLRHGVRLASGSPASKASGNMKSHGFLLVQMKTRSFHTP